jgi:site-specific DNA-adenine methylase
MFSYYGSKSKIVDYYPPPKHKKIIEPFAGSARYSLKYWQNDVLLVDKYEVIVRIWKWLQQCSKQDILGLPKFETGVDLRECNLSEDELLFLGMCAGIASTQPRYKISPYAGEQNGRKNRFKRIAEKLHQIKHWEIRLGCYTEIENEQATWFIDPPYQFGGHAYIENKIDFNHLANWCKSRNGQTIVCENTKADWLPFMPVTKIQGAGQTFTTEAIWSNHKTNYDNVQVSLFEGM